jgi:hypothetical protein
MTKHAISLSIGILALIATLSIMKQWSHMRYSDEPPTVFHFMSSRYDQVIAANSGFQQYGVRLIGIDKGRLTPEPVADDTGIVLAVPQLVQMFHISVARAFDLVLGTTLVLSALCGYFGLRALDVGSGALFLFVICLAAASGDYYIFLALPGLAAIPWLFRYAGERKHLAFCVTAILAALWAGVCNVFRSGAGTPYIVMIVLLVLLRYAKSRIIILVPVLIGAFLVSGFYVKAMIARRDQFLLARGTPSFMTASHPLWHSVYIGLGWIHNVDIPRYQDEVGMEKVKSIDPSARLGSIEYDRILRHEVYKIAVQKPWIIAVNLLVKFVVIISVLGLLALPALKAWRTRRTLWWFDVPFVLGMGIGALPGLLVTPNFRYILAGICCACLYSVLSLQFADRMKDVTQPSLARVDTV